MDLKNLDDRTRTFMMDELQSDLKERRLYYGTRLSPDGRDRYPELISTAIMSGDDHTLAVALAETGILVSREVSQRKGKPYEKDVPVNAPETLAEGEFNRFYMRGLCRRAIEDGIDEVIVYRAKEVEVARSASTAMIGTSLDPGQLLHDLRESIGVDTAFGLPQGPNSGLSARLP